MSTKAKRVKLVVAYDGYDFCGWAPQDGQRTVHGILTEGLKRVTKNVTDIVGASRTDSGAHALGQVCHFDDLDGVPITNWVRALNDALPPDIGVKQATHVKPDFNSRFSAKDRFYRYRIQTSSRDPLRSRYTHCYVRDLDIESMQYAASHMVGEHDFLAFSQGLEPGTNSVRQLFSVEVKQAGDEVWIDVVGTAFLRGMMRRISGALLEVGRGKRTASSVDRLLHQGQEPQPVLLPAHGLCLMRIRYGRHPFDHRLKLDKTQDNEDNE